MLVRSVCQPGLWGGDNSEMSVWRKWGGGRSKPLGSLVPSYHILKYLWEVYSGDYVFLYLFSYIFLILFPFSHFSVCFLYPRDHGGYRLPRCPVPVPGFQGFLAGRIANTNPFDLWNTQTEWFVPLEGTGLAGGADAREPRTPVWTRWNLGWLKCLWLRCLHCSSARFSVLGIAVCELICVSA